jgi:hypothetical protein
VSEITVVVAVALFTPGPGSAVGEVTVAVFESTVLCGVVFDTCTTSVKTALPGAIEACVQVTVPPLPTAGVVHDQPPGLDNDWNVVNAGSVSDIETFAALLGPLFVAVIV